MCNRNLPDLVNFPKHVPSESRVSRLTLVACRINRSLHREGREDEPDERVTSQPTPTCIHTLASCIIRMNDVVFGSLDYAATRYSLRICSLPGGSWM